MTAYVNVCITRVNFIASVGAVNVLGFLVYLPLAHVRRGVGNDIIRWHATRLQTRQDPHRYLCPELQCQWRSLHLQK